MNALPMKNQMMRKAMCNAKFAKERNRAHSVAAPALLLAVTAALAGCATQDPPIIPASLPLPQRAQEAQPLGLGSQRGPEGLKIQELPVPPAHKAPAVQAPLAPASPGVDAASVSAITLEQVALGTFAQVAFAEVLKKNVSIDPKVQARRDLVTFRTGGAQTAAQIEQAVKLLLKSYGVSVVDTGGLIRIVPDDATGSTLPEIRRGNASPETPLPLRPVFHLIELNAVRPAEITVWLRTVFGTRVTAQEDTVRNAILLSGNQENMAAALEAIRTLDQPAMAGRTSVALTPSFWSAEDLARRLFEVLSAEGYAVQPVGTNAGAIQRAPILLLPISALNSVFVFTSSDALSRHVSDWAARLDRPNERGIGKNYFTYAVKHKDAASLAQTLEQMLTGTKPVAAAAAAPGAAAGAAGAATPSRPTSVVVDAASNTLIFQANPDEYSQLTSLLQILDRPVKSALIEVTVAELSLDKDSQLGVQWFFNQTASDGTTAIGKTQGLAKQDAGGFLYSIIGSAGGAQRLLLNALASDNKATILSSPRVSARNGEQAVIQVGQEVPIQTSQLSTSNGTGGGLAVASAVQYRNTGVILKVKPAIHSGDQIDLDVDQEVSAAQPTTTGVNNSPTISTRKFTTKLTLRSGSTVMLGGLISDESSGGTSGVPLLKDIPLLGNLFKSQTTAGKRRELIVLITPYVINDQYDAEAITDAFRRSLGNWAQPLAPANQQKPLVQPLSGPRP